MGGCFFFQHHQIFFGIRKSDNRPGTTGNAISYMAQYSAETSFTKWFGFIVINCKNFKCIGFGLYSLVPSISTFSIRIKLLYAKKAAATTTLSLLRSGK